MKSVNKWLKLKKNLISNFSLTDLLWLSFPVLLMTLLFYLPINWQAYLELNVFNPNLLSLYFSRFIHANKAHFLSNLRLYFALILFPYLFSLLINFKDSFRKIFFWSVSFIPVLISLIELIAFQINDMNVLSCGFSSINSLIIGLYPYVFFNILDKKRDVSSNHLTELIIFTLGVVSFVLGYNILISFVLVIIPLVSFKRSYNREEFFSLFFILVIFSLMVYFTVDLGSPTKDQFINIFGHYVGLIIGLILGSKLSY